jgi:hypothetical protein
MQNILSSAQIAGKNSPVTARKLGGYNVIFRSGEAATIRTHPFA